MLLKYFQNVGVPMACISGAAALDTPGKCGNTFRRPAAYRIHGPFYPSVVLTEPPGDARYGSLIMLWWFIAIQEAVPDLQTGYRSALLRASWRSPLMWLLITGLCLKNVYSVVKEHLVRRPRNNLVVTGKIVSAEGMILKGREVPVSDPLSTGRERTVRNAKRISESYVEIRALQPEFSVRFMS